MHGNITIHLPGTRVHLIFSSYSRAEFIESASAPHFFTLLLSFALPLPLSPNLVKWRKGDWLTEWHEQGVSEIFFMFLNVKNFLAVNYTGLDFKACTWLRVFLPIFPKIAVRQTVGDCGAAEGNSKPCKPVSPTQYIKRSCQSRKAFRPNFWSIVYCEQIVCKGNIAMFKEILLKYLLTTCSMGWMDGWAGGWMVGAVAWNLPPDRLRVRGRREGGRREGGGSHERVGRHTVPYPQSCKQNSVAAPTILKQKSLEVEWVLNTDRNWLPQNLEIVCLVVKKSEFFISALVFQ